jgi:hypothetical protein
VFSGFTPKTRALALPKKTEHTSMPFFRKTRPCVLRFFAPGPDKEQGAGSKEPRKKREQCVKTDIEARLLC